MDPDYTRPRGERLSTAGAFCRGVAGASPVFTRTQQALILHAAETLRRRTRTRPSGQMRQSLQNGW
jgi:hypothetical protein